MRTFIRDWTLILGATVVGVGYFFLMRYFYLNFESYQELIIFISFIGSFMLVDVVIRAWEYFFYKF